MALNINEITTRLNARHNSSGWTARCPGHDDKNPSLSISEGNDGRVLLHCHAGCTPERIMSAMGLTLADLMPSNRFTDDSQKARIVATYDYTDADGNIIFQVVRYDPKDFRQRRPDPANPEKWVWNMQSVDRILYRLPAVLKAKADGRVVFIAEGEKDVHTLEKTGLTATCNAGGAGKWQPSYSETLTGTKVVIITDKDAPGRQHAGLMLKELTGKTDSVQVIELPNRNGQQVKDAADWIAAGGSVEELRSIVRNAPAWDADQYLDKQDGRAKTSPDNGRKGGRPAAPPASEIAFRFAQDKLKTPEGLSVRHYRDTWYQFENGWFPVSDIEMEKAVITYLQDDPDLAGFATTNYARNILRNLASFNLSGLDARLEMPCWLSTKADARNWIAFSNGIAVDIWSYAEQLAEGHIPENCTRAVSPDLFSGDFVAYPWDANFAIPEKFLDYLDRVQPERENIDMIRRMLGLFMADVQKYEVFFQLYGNGANGKTVLLDILEQLLGQRNVCRVPLESLSPGTRFQSWPLSVSKLNICGEIATDLGSGALAAIEGVFKHCVSGGVIEIEHKGRDKTTARCRARFVMSGNSLPTFIDRSNAIWRRLRIIPFTVDMPIKEQDADLAKKIIADEMPGICLWALDGLAEIIREGRVPECSGGIRLKEKHRMDCDHERMFLTDHYEQGSDADRASSSDLYVEYRDWMTDNGYRALGAGKFFTRLEAVFPCSEVKFTRINGEGKRGVAGIRRKNVSDVSPSTLTPT